ncbi:MAG: hypothetical protein AB7U82_05730 [Blastocatellales bacterium]
MTMNQKPRPTKPPDPAELQLLVREITRYWKAIARRHFAAHPPKDQSTFEQLWPKVLDNFFLAETLRVAKTLRPLFEGRQN